jgi:predicted permease
MLRTTQGMTQHQLAFLLDCKSKLHRRAAFSISPGSLTSYSDFFICRSLGMSAWSRFVNVFRGDRLNREIAEEFEAHLQAAIDAGLDPLAARQSFGPLQQRREDSRDIRVVAWLDALRADSVFGWRQLSKARMTSAAAILSLALGIGACTSAFRLIDALLLRPLPIADPQRVYEVFRHEIGWNGKPETFDGWAYPVFAQMRDAVKSQAELIAVSYTERMDLTYRSMEEMEKAHVQYVSGRMFGSFGLHPSLGRVLTERDDLEPGAHPYAVLSYDYWTRRFERDPTPLGRTFRLDNRLYEIVGVAQDGFTGTEPGTVVDIFLPAMMNPYVTRSDSTWHRTLAVLTPGAAIEPLRQRLDAISLSFERERAKGFTDLSKQGIENYLRQSVLLEPAPSGVSGLQDEHRRSLTALAVLVGLVLLIACANVANLLTAQAAARTREMGLRVSIGAGRGRLIQLMLVESATLAALSGALSAFFAWWSAPFVVAMINPPGDPVRLILPADLRVFTFGIALTILVTLLFGLTPALRASAVRPISALKGGEDPHARGRLMHLLIATQVVFCFVVLFVAGLFAASFISPPAFLLTASSHSTLPPNTLSPPPIGIKSRISCAPFPVSSELPSRVGRCSADTVGMTTF